MRTLSTSLLAAQQSESRTPYVKVEVKNKMTGISHLVWENLYLGTETEYLHGSTAAGDGSLIRVRISPASNGSKLYRQRVANPDLQSDFSMWTYTGQYNCQAVAASAYGSEVAIVWINSNRELRRLKSSDYGVNWNNPELLDYAAAAGVHGLTGAYKTNGDLAVFFTDQTVLRVKKYVSGTWQAKTVWDKTTGILTGVSVVYDRDWNLLLTGQDTDGNYKVWSVIYADGGDVSAGTWSALKEIAAAPAGGDYEYGAIFLDKPDVYRAFYVEQFKGTQSYNRPLWTHLVGAGSFAESYWREPVPFNFSCQYGLAPANAGDYCWLSAANAVWRASMAEVCLDISADIISMKQENLPSSGRLLIELRNDDNCYQNPGQGSLAALKPGSQLEISPGYITVPGNETSSGAVFWLEGREYTSAAGKSTFTLWGIDGWELLKNWRAGHQFRWNKDANDMAVKQMLGFVLARVGLQLEVKSQSAAATGFYPDFTIHPGDRGDAIIQSLLAFVPDLLFLEGVKGYLVNPQAADAADYTYGENHCILEGKYHSGTWTTSQVRVTGVNPGTGVSIVTDSFNWEQMGYFDDRTRQIADRNITAIGAGQALGAAVLRKAEIETISGEIRVPVNCGQQLYDVVEISDSRCGLVGAKKRVMGIRLNYRPARGEYEQTILLGGV